MAGYNWLDDTRSVTNKLCDITNHLLQHDLITTEEALMLRDAVHDLAHNTNPNIDQECRQIAREWIEHKELQT